MLRESVAACVLLLCPLGLSQTLNRPDWSIMCQDSPMIVMGVVETSAWVIRPEKRFTESKTLPDGKVIVNLPNPAEFVVGSIFRIDVQQVIKKHGKIKTGSLISVFVPGFMTSEQPSIVKKQNYLLFLSPLEVDSEQFAGTITYKPSEGRESEAPFKPQSVYGVVRGPNGAVHISSDNLTVVDEVKAAMKRNN